MAITLFLSLPNKTVPTSATLFPCFITPDSFQTWPFPLNSRILPFWCHSQISLIFWYIFPCQTHTTRSHYIPCHSYAIRSMTMFLKVLNKLDFRVLAQTQTIYYYWLTPICKTRIPILRLLKFSHVLVVFYLTSISLQLPTFSI